MDNENYWLLDIDDSAYEKSLSKISSPECESTAYESSSDSSYGPFFVKNDLNFCDSSTIDDSTPLFSNSLESLPFDAYVCSISELNGDIEEFSKIVQTLALFKYYIKNRKNTTNIGELNKRFNAICANCSEKIRSIEEKLKRINYENHYVMVNRKRLEVPYSEMRNRFNLQDSSVKKLKILIDTFNTVIKEYTNISKKILSTSPKTAPQVNKSTQDMDKKALLNEMNDRVKQIELLEQSAKDLNDLFVDLSNIIKKRGDNISNLENEILLSSEQIERGKDDIDFIIKNNGQIQTLYIIVICVAVGTFFFIMPSNLKNFLFKTSNL